MAFEGLPVGRPKIRRRAHAAQQHRNVPLRQTAQDFVQRIVRHLRLDPAQHVVGAKLEDDGVGALRHRPIEPRQPVRGGVAGDAGIFDLGRNPLGGERRLQARHEASVSGRP